MAHFGLEPGRTPPLTDLRILDVGCGGGLVTEPLARMGATVTAIDVTEETVSAARMHAAETGLDIDYRVATAESLAASGALFDLVVSLEVVEHVADRRGFLGALAGLTRPGGGLVLSTLNRTARSFALAIVGAEYVLRWLPRGTHDWRKFVKPAELAADLLLARYPHHRPGRADLQPAH